MKKLIVALIFSIPLNLWAQHTSEKFSLYVQGGNWSSSYLKTAAQKKISTEVETQHHKCIVLNAGFQWNLAKKWRLGTSFTYDHFGTKQRSAEFSNISYLVRGDRIWKTGNQFSAYSGIAAGITKTRQFENEVEIKRKTALACQVYLFGIHQELINRFYLDANIGWGVSGMFCLGAKYVF